MLIETTGLADPAPVLQTLMAHPYLSLRYRLEGVVALVDAVNGEATLDAQLESVKQAAVADRVLLSKRDLAGDSGTLLARLRMLNPTAPVLDALTAAASDILDCGLYDPATKTPDVARWLNDEALLARLGPRAHRHADGTLHVERQGEEPAASDINRHDAKIRAHAFATEQAIPAQSFDLFQDLLRTAHGPKLLRMKGIVKIAENPERPVVIHGVQHVFHAPVPLERWPDEDRRTRLVFVTRDLEPRFVEGLWQAFLGEASPDSTLS